MPCVAFSCDLPTRALPTDKDGMHPDCHPDAQDDADAPTERDLEPGHRLDGTCCEPGLRWDPPCVVDLHRRACPDPDCPVVENAPPEPEPEPTCLTCGGRIVRDFAGWSHGAVPGERPGARRHRVRPSV